MIVVSFRLDVEKEAAFSAFYHHRFLSALLAAVPSLRAARRYQEHHVTGSLRYYAKQFLTILEGDDEPAALAVLQVWPPEGALRDEWEQWRGSALRDLEPPCLYGERWAHPRRPPDGAFGGRPFFLVSVELDPAGAAAFHAWYEGEYLPRNVADVPGWVACRRYSSAGRTPARHLALYEAADLGALDDCLDAMRAPFRLDENMAWKRWDSGPAPVITWEDAATFRPIYRNP